MSTSEKHDTLVRELQEARENLLDTTVVVKAILKTPETSIYAGKAAARLLDKAALQADIAIASALYAAKKEGER